MTKRDIFGLTACLFLILAFTALMFTVIIMVADSGPMDLGPSRF